MTALPANIDSLLVTYQPNVRYLTGFTGSCGCVLITRRRRYFFSDFRYRDQAAKEVKDFAVNLVRGGLLPGLCRFLRARRLKLGTLGVESSRLSHSDFLLLRRLLKGVSIRDAGGIIEKQRQVKNGQEVDRIRRASSIADAALEKLRRYKVTGRTEKEVAWLLESFMRQDGSGPLPFDIIVASGPRSAMPHGIAGDRVINKGEPVVIDMGATVDGYCCDITRTFATGSLSSRQQKIYRTVGEAQELAIQAAEPGAACAGVDKLAREHITAAGFGEAFGHSLGHGVGLEAHEGPLLAPGSVDTLASGMTITIEPGIYTGRTGVRIEDTVLVTGTGAEALTVFPRRLLILK
ncbi:putative peptidase [bacterium BMS3Abin01]|nr:putative peptidase [bacterium BMS3Abin01]